MHKFLIFKGILILLCLIILGMYIKQDSDYKVLVSSDGVNWDPRVIKDLL